MHSQLKALRTKTGFGMPAVLLMGVVAGLWVVALLALVLPSYQHVSRARAAITLRNGAEAALDYAISQLNYTVLGYNGTIADDSTDDGVPGSTQSIPSNVCDPSNVGITASVVVDNIKCPTSSYVYDPQANSASDARFSPEWKKLVSPDMVAHRTPAGNTYYELNKQDQDFWAFLCQPAHAKSSTSGSTGVYTNPNSTGTSSLSPLNNGWRIVTVTAQAGSLTKSLRVILKPSYAQINYMDYALLSLQNMTFNGHPTIDAYNSNWGSYGTSGAMVNGRGDVASFGTLSLGNAPVSGSVYAYGGSGTSVSGGVINGDIYSNGADTSSYTNAKVGGDPAGNIPNPAYNTTGGSAPQGVPQTIPDPAAIASGSTIQTTGTAPNVTAVPTAPSTAVQLPANFSGSLSAGDYVASSINGAITVTSGPVRIFVQGSGASISLSGNSGANSGGIASNLQIYYGGNNPVNISFSGNGSFTGVIDAPNADLKLNGNGDLYGAALTKSVTMNGGGNSGGFHYDVALANDNNLKMPIESHLQAISWQEL